MIMMFVVFVVVFMLGVEEFIWTKRADVTGDCLARLRTEWLVLIPRNTVLLEKLTGSQLAKKFLIINRKVF